MERGKLKPEDENIIQTNFGYLKDELEANDVTDFLFEKKVITLDDKEKINKLQPKSARNEELLVTVLQSGPGTAFTYFLKSLERQYSHVLKHLYRTDEGTVKQCDIAVETDLIQKLSIKFKEKNDEIQRLNDKCEDLSRQLTEVTNERDEALEQVMEKTEDNKELQARLDETETKLLELSEMHEHPIIPETKAENQQFQSSNSESATQTRNTKLVQFRRNTFYFLSKDHRRKEAWEKCPKSHMSFLTPHMFD